MTHAKHVTPFRRKREGKTNYKKRLSLLKSGKPRLVIRRSNTALTLQLVTYHPDGDRVLLTLNSKVLRKHGWSGSVKNLPAAYATGVLFGRRARELKVEEAIVDLGFHQHRAGTRIYAAVKGVVDGGLAVPVSESVFPPPERLAGAHLSTDVAPLLQKLNIELPPQKSAEKSKEES